MVHVRLETAAQTTGRLRRVIASATIGLVDGIYTFEERRANVVPLIADRALAIIRDEEVWSALVPAGDSAEGERFCVLSIHFQDGLDNSGFVGWLASHLKRTLGTGVAVVCGQNTARGGIFDYWLIPVAMRDPVLAEIDALRASGSHPEKLPPMHRTVPGSREFSLHQKRMCIVSQSQRGVVSHETIFEFVEVGDAVTASYSGGRIRSGVLAGVRSGSQLVFRYAQVDADGHVDGGRSTCELSALADGRLRLVENFTWESRPDRGTNVFEELFPDGGRPRSIV